MFRQTKRGDGASRGRREVKVVGVGVKIYRRLIDNVRCEVEVRSERWMVFPFLSYSIEAYRNDSD